MSSNKEDLKNKIIYRAMYRGTKEMDILMIGFVRSIIDNLDDNHLVALNKFVNLDDETLKLLKKKESLIDFKDDLMLNILKHFQTY